ncbi:YhgE/Pip domain-containing protein [Zafaria sp. Z1313]|uniref:YhgE/Pip domain-containing protein n=1 Tax=unclassified Zafaria TaxID=2828765 RepID=UPI002E76AFC1|nr:YhgE/Pip domain-containing protein [Zafaria sp. J156]MEE1622064.1 YhgE/Pip domain-containing protein [Zafaria sp. J156]
MTALRLALSELKRMTHGRLPKIAVVALTLVPLLYGALYLYANWDPYGHLDKVDAAIVNLDRGATSDSGPLEVGDDVVDSLLEDGTFGWRTVDTREAAAAGVASGDYAFALVIPEDFSANLASPEDFDAARQAVLELTTNDANNAMIGTIADKLAGEVHNSVAAEVGEQTADALLTGFGRIHGQLSQAADGAGELHDGTSRLADGAEDLADGTGQLYDGGASLASGARELHAGTGQLLAGQEKLAAGADRLSSGAGELSTGAGTLADGLGTLESRTAGLPASTRELADGAASATDAAHRLADGAEQVAEGNETLNAKVQDAAAVIEALESDAEARLQAASQALVDNGVLTAGQQAELEEALRARAADSAVLHQARESRQQLATAEAQIAQLASGSREVADGARQLAAGTDRLAAGTDTLADAVPALAGGIADAADGAGRLGDGAAELSQGASTLATGQREAVGGARTLDSGAARLEDGSAELVDAAGRLRDGAGGLASGARQVDDGAGELAVKLGEGADQVPNPDDAQKQRVSHVIGDPVAISSTAQTEAGSYGQQLAPFFLTLALWIGAFMLVQLMRPITRRALASNAADWKIAIGGWLPFLAISLVQSTLLYGVVVFGLGLESAHPWMTWALLLGASLAFSALIQGIVAFLGTPGKMVVLILLVLQLVSAGGTFPWETTPEPLHAAHQILPMGYIVTGMRHLMYGADLAVMGPVVLALAAYAVLGVVLSILAVRRRKTWTLTTLHPEMAE